MDHYKISNRGSQVFIFCLLIFDGIHDAMLASEQDVLDLWQKYRPTKL